MKIAVNTCYGEYEYSRKLWELIEDNYNGRTDSRLIDAIEQKGSKWASGEFSAIGIATIPDDATDWKINVYDGKETVIYILDGKIYVTEGKLID